MGGVAEPDMIMVADDEDGVRAFVASVLRRTGYKVIEAHDGLDALFLATNYTGRIPLLVTDCAMPGLDGVRLSQEVSAMHPETKVLFITGCWGEIPAAPECILTKPFCAGDLLARVRSLLMSS